MCVGWHRAGRKEGWETNRLKRCDRLELLADARADQIKQGGKKKPVGEQKECK